MTVKATDQQIQAVQDQLDGDKDAKGNVKSYRHLSKEDAYNEFKRIFRRNPDLVNSIRAQDLPESFRVVPEEGGAHRHGARASSRPCRASNRSRPPVRR